MIQRATLSTFILVMHSPTNNHINIAMASRITLSAVVASFLLLATKGNNSDFDPYQLNGGLVAAVAGKDNVVLAADTRLTGSSGFEILQRQHTSSRLWSMLPCHAATAMQQALRKHAEHSSGTVENELDDYKEETIELPLVAVKDAPVWVGSVGCSTDCEELKRTCQALLRRNLSTGEMSKLQNVGPGEGLPASLAIWLGQVLYGRRGFPYYAFCVLAGCNAQGGYVYGYDAIGSHERLAVAVSGQGRDLLQSILDRSFHSEDNSSEELTASEIPCRIMKTPIQVVETAEETRRLVVEGFRAVAKREASVGDAVIVLCWKYNKLDNCIESSVTFATLPEN